MNKKEKIRILKAMKKMLNTREYWFCCHAYAVIVKLPEDPSGDYWYHKQMAIDGLNELGLTKDEWASDYGVWWDTHEDRINAINEAIKRLPQ